MPRRGENIYKRKDGRWEGRLLKPEGKYQYFYGKTYREAKEKMKLFLENKPAAPDINSKPETKAADLFLSWLECRAIHRVKPSTYESYYHCIQKYIIPFYQNDGYRDISEDTVSIFSINITKDSSLSDAYKKKILTVFKTALREILLDQKEASVILQSIKMPKTEQKEVPIFTRNEQRLIEWTAMNDGDKRALGIVLCFYTGIRLGELCGLRWSDFDLEAATMSVKRTVSRTKNFKNSDKKTILHIGTPKSRTSIRKIPLPAFLIPIARQYKLTGKKEDCYILSGNDTPIDPRAYQKLYKKILVKAGMKDRKFHSTRHTFATRALELHVDIKTVSEILGHSSVAITMNVYAHSLMEQKKIAIDKFNDMYIASTAPQPFAVTIPVTTVLPPFTP